MGLLIRYFLTRSPEGLQDPEGLALGLAPAEDLVQGPTGPEGPTPGYKFYWPEVVVVGGEGSNGGSRREAEGWSRK